MPTEIVSREKLTARDMNMVSRSFTPTAAMIAGLGNVALEYGAGVISSTEKCVWDKDKHRISFALTGGGFIASRSKNPDPDCQIFTERKENANNDPEL